MKLAKTVLLDPQWGFEAGNDRHTPGPWVLGDAYDCGKGLAVCEGSQVVARVVGFGYPIGTGSHPASTANARLMAAAPDLLEALYGALNILSYYHKGEAPGHLDACENPYCCGHCQVVREARAAIAKAKGA